MSARKGTCEDGCQATDVWVEVRRNWRLICDACAAAEGVLFADKRTSRKG